MRTLAIRTAAATTAMVCGLSMAAAAGPQYIGRVTGHAERDTYASVVAHADVQALCIAPPARYFGAVTGNAEKDTYGYTPVKLAAGSKCPDAGKATAE